MWALACSSDASRTISERARRDAGGQRTICAALRVPYRKALLAWWDGNHDILFSAGTLLMRTAFGVRVAPSSARPIVAA